MPNAAVQSGNVSADQSAGRPKLKRVLGLWELVLYGIILIQPTAPLPIFGIINREARGHVVTTILFGMVAMMLTAVSYGRMASAYPVAGSAYSYVGRELRPSLGFLTGWSMIFDYVMNPLISIIWCSITARQLVSQLPYGQSVAQLPYVFWAVAFAALFTGLNLRGIKASARTNNWLAAALGVVVVLFFGYAIRWLCAGPVLSGGAFLKPFYNPETFTWGHVSTGASIAVLTYIGFDGISTLSEEARNPRRNILLATVLTCLVTGLLAGAEVYVAQLVWPAPGGFANPETAFSEVAAKVGGKPLLWIVSVALLIAQVGSGSGAHLAGGRLLYGMGRDNALPGRFFAAVSSRTLIPRNNIVLVGVVALIGALVLERRFDLGCQLLNFGAFIGFMGVNIAAFFHFFVRNSRKTFLSAVMPLLGFVICFYLWYSLEKTAKYAGLTWLTVGLLYGAWRTNGFRKTLSFSAIEE